MSAADWERARTALRPALSAHRRALTLVLSPVLHLQFEDLCTVRAHVLELLRIEGERDAARRQAVWHEHAGWLPDGRGWRATLLIGIADAAERRHRLPALSDAAHALDLSLPSLPPVRAVANADLPDRHLGRPSAVHFLRFEPPPAVRRALRDGAPARLAATAAGCSAPLPRALVRHLNLLLEPADADRPWAESLPFPVAACA